MKILAVLMLFFTLLLAPVQVFAAPGFSGGTGGVDCSGAAADSPVCKDLGSTGNPLFGPTGILTRVGLAFGLFAGIISVFMVIIGGLRYVTSAGDPSKTSSARNTITYAAIGLAVSMAAGAIAQFILSKVS